MQADPVKLEEVAYYYPEPYWSGREGTWVKTLLLFFDSVAILLPSYMYGRQSTADPTLALPLEERGLLHVLRPEEFLDQATTEKLSEAVVDLIVAGAFDDLPDAPFFAELSRSRMGWNADVGLSSMLIEELTSRGLARSSEDGVSVPLHPYVRTAILVLLSQLVREAGRVRGLHLNPTTNRGEPVQALLSLLNIPQMPTRGDVVTMDLEAVTLNLESVPLDDVLQFRTEHGADYRAYARDLHKILIEISILPADARSTVLLDRQEELSDRAHDLRKASRRTWRLPLARFSFGAAGAAWNLATGDVPGAITSLGSSLLELHAEGPETAAAYSYLFSAERALHRD